MDLTGSEKPVGTLEELNQLNIDKTRFGSCSMRTNDNKGCPWFRSCRFREYRDRVGGKVGPLNIGVRIVLSPIDGGASDTKVMPCFDYYGSGLHNRQRQSADTGELIKVIAFEGDGKKVRSRITVRAHPKPVPGCLSCAKGECYRRATAIEGGEDGQVVPKFARPREMFQGMVEAERAREEMLAEEDADTMRMAVAKSEELGARPQTS
jgi:hypothetical protein